MLRPDDLIGWFKLRSQAGQNELSQLFDGLIPGGQVVVGGGDEQATKARQLMGMRNRIGRIHPMSTAQLDPKTPTTFDTGAIAQLVMIARNENFHQTVQMVLTMVRDIVADGHSLEVTLQTVTDHANQIQKL